MISRNVNSRHYNENCRCRCGGLASYSTIWIALFVKGSSESNGYLIVEVYDAWTVHITLAYPYPYPTLDTWTWVEHPVTEWIAEVNLPAAQVAVGMGIPLWQIPEIRRFYGKEHGGGYDAWRKTSVVVTPFDFGKAESVRPKGYCVAVRVTSEDPDDGFKPTSGKVQELNFKSKPNVWAYFSIKSGGGIHEFSDSQFGHVFAFGESRGIVIANMVLGLKEIQIRGEIRTNVDYTIDLLHVNELGGSRGNFIQC